MRGEHAVWAVVATAAMVGMSFVAAARAEEPAPLGFLSRTIGFSAAEIATAGRGEVVTKLLPDADKGEIAAFGVVRVAATQERFFERLKDFPRFRKVPQIPEIGRFSSPARIEDLAGLTVPDADLAALRKCRSGDCSYKMGQPGLDRLAKLDWRAQDAEAQAAGIVKTRMVENLNEYLRGGTDAMRTIVDKQDPRPLSREFRLLLTHSTYLHAYDVAFYDYLRTYPKGSLPGVEHVFYWSKDTFGLKPVISMYHVAIRRGEKSSVLSQKLLYASHYFNAGVETMGIVDAANGRGLYLLNLYRVRIDPPTGMLSGILLSKIHDGIRTGVAQNLKHAKERVEANQ